MTSGPIEPLRPLAVQRDAAVLRLQDAYADGLVTHDELADRLHAMLTARTDVEVAAAVGALPEPAPGRVVTIAGISGKIRRTGPWRVPRVLRIESEYGGVRLDFTRAVFESAVVDVELQLRFGRAKLIVPRNAAVDLEGLRTNWKQPRYDLPTGAPSGGPVIRVTGLMDFGRITVRHARR